MSGKLEILSPGLGTSVQDLGRPGFQRLGVPVGGALDAFSLRVANLLVGNAPDFGALEMLYRGPRLRVGARSARIAVFGARAKPMLWREGAASELETGRSHLLRAGDEVEIGAFAGAAAYMAVEGGFAIAPVMGGVSTYLRGGLGGWRGRLLQAGDELPLTQERALERDEGAFDVPAVSSTAVLRFVDGPQAEDFAPEEMEAFQAGEYLVGASADRMGARLFGRALKPLRGHDIVSDGLRPGSIQIPGDGQPIVMRCEHQTTGGYPKIANVIYADWPALGRLGIGDRVRFQRITMEAAEAEGAAYRRALEALPRRIRAAPTFSAGAPLYAVNLISGVYDARQGLE